MRPYFGDDYGISPVVYRPCMGKDMQIPGPANPAKLFCMPSTGWTKLPGDQVGPKMAPYDDQFLDYDDVITALRYRWTGWLHCMSTP